MNKLLLDRVKAPVIVPPVSGRATAAVFDPNTLALLENLAVLLAAMAVFDPNTLAFDAAMAVLQALNAVFEPNTPAFEPNVATVEIRTPLSCNAPVTFTLDATRTLLIIDANAGLAIIVDLTAGKTGLVVETLFPVPARRTFANIDNSGDQHTDDTLAEPVRDVQVTPSELDTIPELSDTPTNMDSCGDQHNMVKPSAGVVCIVHVKPSGLVITRSNVPFKLPATNSDISGAQQSDVH